MATHLLQVGDEFKLLNLRFRVRKINKKDVIIRLVKPTVEADSRMTEKREKTEKKEKTENKSEPGSEPGSKPENSSSSDEELFKKTF